MRPGETGSNNLNLRRNRNRRPSGAQEPLLSFAIPPSFMACPSVFFGGHVISQMGHHFYTPDRPPAELGHGFRSNTQSLLKIDALHTWDRKSIEEDVGRGASHLCLFISSLAQDADNPFFVSQHNLSLLDCELAHPHANTCLSSPGYIEQQGAFYEIEIGDRHKDASAHLGHEVGVNHEIVAGKSTVDGSLEMLGQRACISEALEERVIGVDALRDLGKGLPFSHFAKELSFILIKPGIVLQGPTFCYEGQAKGNTGVDGLIA